MRDRIENILHSGNLSLYTCILCVSLLAVRIHWLPPFMVALVIFRWCEPEPKFISPSVENRRAKFLLILFVLLFLWQLAGLILADSIITGLERIVKRASFVLFPAALFSPSEKIRNKLDIILKIFVFCTIGYLLFCLVNAIDNSLVKVNGILNFRPYHPVNTWESWFTGFRLSGNVHPSYLAMYVLLSVLLCIDFFFKSTKKQAFWWLLIAILLFIIILLLSSRAGIISALVTIPLLLYFKLKIKYSMRYFAVTIIVFITAFIFLLSFNSRIKYTLDDISRGKISQTLQDDIRLNIWRSAFGAIKQHVLFGVGTGNASNELKNEFVKRGYTEGLYETLNAHNQFLEILLENGIIGLIIFLMILIYTGFISIVERNYILLVFVCMMIIFFLFESMLNRLAGVTFYPLFTFLLIHWQNHAFKNNLFTIDPR